MGDQEGDQQMNGQEDQEEEDQGPELDGSSLLRGLRFQPPEPFDGSDNKFEFFSMKLRSYLCLSDIRFREYLTQSEESGIPMDWDQMDARESRNTRTLYNTY